MKFRKKPVVIEAVQWFPGVVIDGVSERKTSFSSSQSVGIVNTLEGGEMIASPGDWIIKGVKGKLYPVKNDIFEATYERFVPALSQGG